MLPQKRSVQSFVTPAALDWTGRLQCRASHDRLGVISLMDWFEIAVAADDEAVEAVAEVFRANGYGVAIDEPFLQPRLDEAPIRDPTRRPIVKTYVPDDERAPE